MNYAALDYTNYGAMAFILGFGVPAALLIITLIILEIMQSKRKSPSEKSGRNYLIAFAGLIAITIGLTLFMENLGGAALKSNQEKATQNIMQKYDVKNVDWENKKTNATPILSGEENEVIVQAHDGKEYVFQYELNRNTNEPTLKDMPIQGGSNSNVALSANDLLK